MRKSVLAIAAHPDDIEFCMSGTMLRLVEAGWEAHYFNIANGCCGSMTIPRAECAATRLEEAKKAAAALPATFYAPICDDMEIFYNRELHQKVSSVVRQAKPSIVLTHAWSDYMQDHENAARLAASGAFMRCATNFVCDPPQPIFEGDIAIYHAQPHSNMDPLRNLVEPKIYVDISDLREKKLELLRFHESQKAWLDASQGMDSYLNSMEDFGAEVGRMSGKYELAEGWTQHAHMGFAATAEFDPLRETLGIA